MQIATPTAWRDYIVPAIGLVGTLVTVIATWAKDLNASAQRIRTLDEATKRAAFWDTWSKAMAAADPEANQATFTFKVKNEVLAAADSVEKAFHVLAVQQATDANVLREHEHSLDSISRVRRWLLLYRPPRVRAWIPRTFFYFYVIETPLLAIFQMIGTGGKFGFLLSLAAVFIFRSVSIWAEGPRAEVLAAH
jgi:hypothetical protein